MRKRAKQVNLTIKIKLNLKKTFINNKQHTRTKNTNQRSNQNT